VGDVAVNIWVYPLVEMCAYVALGVELLSHPGNSMFNFLTLPNWSQVPVVHAYNHSYLGG
jgi:hypothetical protein